MNPSEKLSAPVAAAESDVADSCTAVGIDIIIYDGFGYISYPLLIAEIEKRYGIY